MLKKIASGYGRLFSSVAKIFLLAALCLGLSFTIVYPLWKWAISSPTSYSWAVFALVCAALVYFIVRSIKKNGVNASLLTFAKQVVVLGGLCGCVFFVLHGQRILALVCFIAMFIVYGILAFGFHGNTRTSKKAAVTANNESKEAVMADHAAQMDITANNEPKATGMADHSTQAAVQVDDAADHTN